MLFISLLFIRGCSNGENKKKAVYLIGRENVWQIQLLGRERSLIAFTNDLMSMIGAENQIRFEWIETNPSYLANGLVEETYDFILTTMSPTNVNKEHYHFSELLFYLGPVLIVREDSPISSLKEMKGKPVGISFGLDLDLSLIKRKEANLDDIILTYYNNMDQALEALINDNIDGVILRTIPAYAITKGLYAGKLKVVTPPLNEEGLRIVSLKKSSLEQTIDTINQTLEKMREEGTYEILIRKWNLVNPKTEFSKPINDSP